MEKYLRALVFVFLVFGLFGTLSGVIVLITLKTSIFDHTWLADYVARKDFKDYRSILSIIFYLPMLIAAYGLHMRKKWGRMMAIIWSVLYLPFFPEGTILAFFSLWVLLKKRTKQLFGVDESALI